MLKNAHVAYSQVFLAPLTIVKTFTFLLLFLVSGIAELTQAQTLPTVVQAKTPEVTAFNKRVETPVSLYTGVPNISIPIYTITTPGGISIPISLDYHAGGVQVDQEATWVGLGWSLNTGGQVSRKQRGAPDEKGFLRSGISNIDNYLALPDRQNSVNPNQLPERQQAIAEAKIGNRDYLPDEFYYASTGSSGRFMYSQRLKKFVLYPKEDIAVSYAMNQAGTAISSWRLKNASGIITDFGQDGAVSQATPNTPNVATAWNIKRITDPHRFSVNYAYETYAYTKWQFGQENFLNYDFNDGTTYYCGGPPVDPNNRNYNPSATIQNINYSDSRVSSISFPAGSVLFSTSPRQDMVAPNKSLTKIEVRDATGNIVKLIQFYYSYFDGRGFARGPDTTLVRANYQFKRLRLDSLSVQNLVTGQQNQTYRFDYYTSAAPLPSKYTYAQDHWGYYNGTYNPHLIPNFVPSFFTGADRSVQPTQAIAFALKSVRYPEGGKTAFIYGSNTGHGPQPYNRQILQTYDDLHFTQKSQYINVSLYNGTSFFASGSAPVTSASNASTHTYTYTIPFTVKADYFMYYGFGWSCSTNFGLNANAYASNGGRSNEVLFRVIRVNADGSRSTIKSFSTLTGATAGQTPRKGSNQDLLDLVQAGNYELSVTINNDVPPPNTSAYTSRVEIKWREFDSTVNTLYAGGLRIDTIKYYDFGNKLVKQRAYDYNLPNSYTSGNFSSFPQYRQPVVKTYIEQCQANTNGPIATASHTWRGDKLYSSSVVPLTMTAGSSIGYEYVTEKDVDLKSPAIVLATRSHFSFLTPYYSSYLLYNNPGMYEPQEWLRGKLLGKEYFKGSKPILTENYTYASYSPHLADATKEDFVQELNTDLISWQTDYLVGNGQNVQMDFFDEQSANNRPGYGTTSCIGFRYDIINTSAGRSAPNFCEQLRSIPYFERYTGFDKPLTKIITRYDELGNKHVEQESYRYDKTPIHYQLTSTQKLLIPGDTLRTIMSYPTELKTDASKALVAQHRLDIPLLQFTYKNRRLLTTSATVYGLRADSLVVPQLKQYSEGIASLETQVLLSAYDNYGNPTRIKQKNGLASAFIWDNSGLYPIAEIAAAGTEAVAYTSFETGESGNWVINSSLRTTSVHAGSYSYELSSGTISSPALKVGISYQVSYWTTNAQPFTSIGGTAVALRTVKGWTLYQHLLSGVSSITLSGTGLLDDLRLVPAGAQMTTLTYRPLIGIAAKTGPDNRTLSYEYDGLGRLVRTRDEQGRILSQQQYHYADK